MSFPRKNLLIFFILILVGSALVGCSSSKENIAADTGEDTITRGAPWPSDLFDETYWKLQYPAESNSGGQLEQANLTNWENWYFYDSSSTVAFRVNCDQGGTSDNSEDRRSELRQTKNAGWTVSGSHSFTCTFKVYNVSLTEQTMMQIHDDPNLSSGAPNKPLLRIIAAGTTLKAKYKTDKNGVNTATVTLKSGLTSGQYNTVKVTVSSGKLYVYVNGTVNSTLNGKDISFWTWKNYWKAGVYSQDHTAGQDAVIYFSSIGNPS